jgi:membrane associated rhomboid family serine protease
MYFFYYLPLGVDVETRRFPVLTVYFAALCTTVTLLVRLGSGWIPFDPYRLMYVPGQSPWLTVFTAAFLHFGWLHLVGNLVFLVIFGGAVEDRLGPAAYTVLFLTSAALGNWAQGVFDERVLGQGPYGIVGASGAVSGVLGAFLVLAALARLRLAYWVFLPLQGYTRAGRVELPAILALLLWFLLQTAEGAAQLGGSQSGVATITHLAGFAWGVAFALACGGVEKARVDRARQLARRYLRDGHAYAACGAWERYLQYRPEDAEGWRSLAQACIVAGRPGRARAAYRRAIGIELDRRWRGRAEAIYEEALRAFPDFTLEAERQLDLAFGLERDLKPRTAVRAYENFARRFPTHPEAPFTWLRSAHLKAGVLGEPREALRTYRFLLRRYPEDRWADFAREEIRRLEAVEAHGSA